MDHPRVADLIDRIPALRELRGCALIEAEEAIPNAFADAIEDYVGVGQVPPVPPVAHRMAA